MSVPDIIRDGFEKCPVSDHITWDEWLEKGYYVVPPQQDWESIPAGFYKFWEDPVANPLQTPTGKLEFYSTGLAEHFPDDPERPRCRTG